MMTIDYALRIYTDMLSAGDKISIKYFEENLNSTDFKEFQELIPFINLIKSSKLAEKFHKTFDKVDVYKKAIYDVPSAANFRSKCNSDTDEATNRLDQIFDEEFGDE